MADKKFSVEIDLQDTIDEFSLDQTQVEVLFKSIKRAVILEVQRNWILQAQNELNSTRKDYIAGLQVFEDGDNAGGIKLSGVLNNMIENGCGPFDMKEGFQKSVKVKYSKDGHWFITIPFKIGTPGANPENFANIMPRSIYDLIRSLPVRNGSSQLSDAAIQASNVPNKYKAPRVRNAIPANNPTGVAGWVDNMFEQYTHKTSIFSGLQRNVTTYPSGAQQSTYNTFRRAGQLSDPNSWIHKGLPRKDLGGKALDQTDIDTIVNNTADKTLAEFGFGE